MHFQTPALLTAAFALGASAAPACSKIPSLSATSVTATVATVTPASGSGTAITANLITSIAPDTATCSGAQNPDECADATRAAVALNKAFTQYQNTPGEQAAILALILFESGNFKYNKNHYPGRPGQGTRNMMMPNYISQYATELVGAQAVAAATPQGPDAVLKLVSEDDLSFASASWFLSKCSPDIRTGLSAGTTAGWQAYLTSCVGTTDTADRDALYKPAVKAIMGKDVQ